MDFNKLNILFFLIFFLLSVPAFGENIKYDDYDNSLGIKASNISGYGFYYRKKINDDFSLQFMGLIYYFFTQNDEREYTNFNYDFGIELQRNILTGENHKFYILAGGYYYYDDDENNRLLNNKRTLAINNSFNVGIGIGYELFYKRFLLNIELGYKFFEDNKEITEDKNPAYPELHRVTKIGAGIGLGFTF